MASAGLYQDRGLSPYSQMPSDSSPYTPVNGQAWEYDEGLYDPPGDPPGGVDASTAAFANQDTLTSCSQYLEPVLQDLGVKQWQLQDGDAVAVLNGLYEVVQMHQAVLGSRAALQDELQKLKVDVKTADKTIQRLQGQSEQKAQEAGGLNIKLRQLDAWYREETDRWAGEREQMAKKCAQLEQRHVQFQHELRRKDGEFEKLQKQLATHLSGSSRRGAKGSSSAGHTTGKITISSRNGVATAGGGSKIAASSMQTDTRRATKAELEEIHKRVVEAYEADKQELLHDNAALRKALQGLEREHKDLLNQTEQQHMAASSSAPESIAGSVQLPAPAAALQHMHSKLEALKVRKQRITGSGSSLELQELQQHVQSANERLLMAKLLEASKILEEQEDALAIVLDALPGSGTRI